MAYEVTGQLIAIQSAFIRFLRKNWNKMKHYVSDLHTSRKLMSQLGGGSCITFSLSMVSHENGKVNKNVSK